jgi:CO/xanthine dehydrogenase FAD-binding subunit
LSLPQFRLLRPRAVDEAVAFLSKHGANIRVLAGGTDLIPSMRQKLFEPG